MTREKFLSLISAADAKGCSQYLGRCEGLGYGRVWYDGRLWLSHRLFFSIHWGVRLPDWLCVLHECDNPPCCSPDHLWIGTKKDNMEDMKAKGRAARGERSGSYTHPESRKIRARGDRSAMRLHPELVKRGEENPNSKLTWLQVKEIRRRHASGEMQCSLAQVFGVSKSLVHAIIKGILWKERNMDLADLQKSVGEWSRRNFPSGEPLHPLLGVIEELAELTAVVRAGMVVDDDRSAVIADLLAAQAYLGKLTHGVLKGLQGIRGWGPEDVERLSLVADRLVTFLDGQMVEEKAQLDYGTMDLITEFAAKIDALGDLTIYLADYAHRNGIGLSAAVERTWHKVQQRDWQRDPLKGGEV